MKLRRQQIEKISEKIIDELISKGFIEVRNIDDAKPWSPPPPNSFSPSQGRWNTGGIGPKCETGVICQTDNHFPQHLRTSLPFAGFASSGFSFHGEDTPSNCI